MFLKFKRAYSSLPAIATVSMADIAMVSSSSSNKKKRPRVDDESEMAELRAKRAKRKEERTRQTTHILARLDTLEKTVREQQTLLAAYQDRYPIKPPPAYWDTKWAHFRSLHPRCSNVNHHAEEMKKYDDWMQHMESNERRKTR
jgi:hypothetical protein